MNESNTGPTYTEEVSSDLIERFKKSAESNRGMITPIVNNLITTGHALAIHVINLLAENKSLVSTVSLSTRKDGSTMLTFETHPEEA